MDEQQQYDSWLNLRGGVAFGMILCGALVILWVVWNVYQIFTNPALLTPFQSLVSATLETKLSYNNGEIALLIPPAILAYAIPLLLLSTAMGADSILLNGGIQLLTGKSRTNLHSTTISNS